MKMARRQSYIILRQIFGKFVLQVFDLDPCISHGVASS